MSMETNTRVNGRIIRNMESENSSITKRELTMVTGRMAKDTERESSLIQTKTFIVDLGNMETKRALVLISSLTLA